MARPTDKGCLMCKHQNKECLDNCFFLKHFPYDKKEQFEQIKKSFGIYRAKSKIEKTPVLLRNRVVQSLLWEADAWAKDPVDGPYGLYNQLKMQQKKSDGNNVVSNCGDSVQENDGAMYYNQGQGKGNASLSNNQRVRGNECLGLGNYDVNENQYVKMKQQRLAIMPNEGRNVVRQFDDLVPESIRKVGYNWMHNQGFPQQQEMSYGCTSNVKMYAGHYGNSLQESDMAMGQNWKLNQRFSQPGTGNYGKTNSVMVRGNRNERELQITRNYEQLEELQRNHVGQVNEAQRNGDKQWPTPGEGKSRLELLEEFLMSPDE